MKNPPYISVYIYIHTDRYKYVYIYRSHPRETLRKNGFSVSLSIYWRVSLQKGADHHFVCWILQLPLLEVPLLNGQQQHGQNATRSEPHRNWEVKQHTQCSTRGWSGKDRGWSNKGFDIRKIDELTSLSSWKLGTDAKVITKLFVYYAQFYGYPPAIKHGNSTSILHGLSMGTSTINGGFSSKPCLIRRLVLDQ